MSPVNQVYALGSQDALQDCTTRRVQAQIKANRELIDVPAGNAEVREALKRHATELAAAYCGATSPAAFEHAVTEYLHDLREIERKGWCLACGGPLVDESTCVRCGRDNS